MIMHELAGDAYIEGSNINALLATDDINYDALATLLTEHSTREHFILHMKNEITKVCPPAYAPVRGQPAANPSGGQHQPRRNLQSLNSQTGGASNGHSSVGPPQGEIDSRRKQVEARLTPWIMVRAAQGEKVTARQVRDTFHKQHRAAGGEPHQLTSAIQQALAAARAHYPKIDLRIEPNDIMRIEPRDVVDRPDKSGTVFASVD